jgi:hypothetical protein
MNITHLQTKIYKHLVRMMVVHQLIWSYRQTIEC